MIRERIMTLKPKKEVKQKVVKDNEDDNLAKYKQQRIKAEEFRTEMREKVKDRIDTLIRFECEQARKPKDEIGNLAGLMMSESQSA